MSEILTCDMATQLPYLAYTMFVKIRYCFIVFAHPRFSDIDFCISYSSVSGVLPDVIEYYNITNAQAGLLQTSFIFVYMIFSPLFGYLGDRYNRKWLMAIGIFLWSVITLAGSFVPAKVS